MVADRAGESPTDDERSTPNERRRATPVDRSNDREANRPPIPESSDIDADGRDFESPSSEDDEEGEAEPVGRTTAVADHTGEDPTDRLDSTDGAGDDIQVPEPRSTPVRPERVDIENAAFVAFGAVLTIAILARMAAVAF